MHFALFSCGIAQVSLRYPLEGGGVSHRCFACSPRGKRSEKGEGVSHPIGLVKTLRGPAATLFISRDTFSDSIAKLFRACFPGVSHKYRAICCKYWGIALIRLCNKAPKGGIAPCWGISQIFSGMAEKVSRDRVYRSDSIAISRDMGPLS